MKVGQREQRQYLNELNLEISLCGLGPAIGLLTQLYATYDELRSSASECEDCTPAQAGKTPLLAVRNATPSYIVISIVVKDWSSESLSN